LWLHSHCVSRDVLFARHFISGHTFLFIDEATSEIYTLSLHDALPILRLQNQIAHAVLRSRVGHRPKQREAATLAVHRVAARGKRSEEHTSELQSRRDLVCRLLLEKKKSNEWLGPLRRCECRLTRRGAELGRLHERSSTIGTSGRLTGSSLANGGRWSALMSSALRM